MRLQRLTRPSALAWALWLAALAGCTGRGSEGQPVPDANAQLVPDEGDRRPERRSSLAGTSWRLTGYDSFESGTERAVPAAGEVVIIGFEAAGRLTLQLACHRGSGRWHASQRERDRGSLEITSIVVSRTRCPGARMTRIVEDLEYVGSFVLAGDELVLNLRADSGNLTWKRAQ